MNQKTTSATWVLALAVLAGSADVSALTLGRVRGAVLLGQALDVTIPVQSDADDELNAGCFAADVFYGEARIEGGLVTVTTQPGAAGKAATVHVTSSAKVDEPVVSVYLKTVCAQKSSRKYVLLADMASDTLPASAQAVPLQLQQATTVSRTLPPSASASVSAAATTGSSGTTGATDKRSAKRSLQAKAGTDLANPVAPRAAQTQPASGRRSHLKLAPLDMSVERDLMLRSTTEMISTPVEDLQKRVEALAMWRALNASAQDVLRDEARMQALEADLKRLSQVTARNNQTLQEVTGRLEQSEGQRYSNPLVYALAVALMACLAGIALLWQRLRKAGAGEVPWWGSDAELSEQQSVLREELADVQGAAASTPAAAPARWADPEVPPLPVSAEVPQQSTPPVTGLVDIDLEMGESIFSPVNKLSATPGPITMGNPTQPAQVSAVRGDFQPSTSGAMRAVNTKEMLDVRQQADFFMTLGQYEEAIRLLVTSIQSSEDSNPLLYLDLLKIFHTLSRKAEFDKYRTEFNQQFTGIVPAYADFNSGGSGLDAYPEMCQKIGDVWPSEEAVQFIEHCLVRSPEESSAHGLDLEAFRDLLMLHAVARRMESFADSGLAPFSAARAFTGVTQLTGGSPAATLSHAALTPFPAVPDPSQHGVDLDLSTGGGNLIDFDISDDGLGRQDAPDTEPPNH